MGKVQEVSVPPGSFLHKIAQQDGVYTDCFEVGIAADVAFADYIAAFYTTPIFKAERVVLRPFAQSPSTDVEARELGEGKTDRFAVWRMQERSDNQLLMWEGRTSSWFMLVPASPEKGSNTRLMFGSVVLPVKDKNTGVLRMGFGFKALLGAHKLYSRILLSSARRHLLRTQNP